MIIKDLGLKSYLDDIFGSQKKKSSPSTPSVSQIDLLILQHRENSENINNLVIIRELENKATNENYDQTNHNYNSSYFKDESQLSKSRTSIFEQKSKPSLHEKIKSAKTSKQKLIFKKDKNNNTNKISSDTSSLEGINFDLIETLLQKHEEMQQNEKDNQSFNDDTLGKSLIEKNEFCGFKTAKGANLILNPAKVKKAEKLLFSPSPPFSSNENNSFNKLDNKKTFFNENQKDLSKKKIINNNNDSNFMGFKTGTGIELNFNPKNLEKAAQILFSPEPSPSKNLFNLEIGNKNESINFGLKPGKNQLLICEEQAEKLLLVPPSPPQKSFLVDGKDEIKNKNSKNNFFANENNEIKNKSDNQFNFMGFKTAKGRDLKLDEKKLLKAEKLLFSPTLSQKELFPLEDEKSKKIAQLNPNPSPSKLSNNSSTMFFTAKGSALVIDPSKIAKVNQLFSSTLPAEKNNFLSINPLSLLKAQQILASPTSSPQKVMNSTKPNQNAGFKTNLISKNHLNNVSLPSYHNNHKILNELKPSKPPSKSEKEEQYQQLSIKPNINMTSSTKHTPMPNNFILEETTDVSLKDRLGVLVPGGNILKSAKKVQEVEGFFTGKGRKIEISEDKVKKAEQMLYAESVKKKKEQVKSVKKSENKGKKNSDERQKLENENNLSIERLGMMQGKLKDISCLRLISEENDEKIVLEEKEKAVINCISDATKIVEEKEITTSSQRNIYPLHTPLNTEVKRKQTSRKRLKRTSSFKKFFPSEKKNMFNDFSTCTKILLKDLKLIKNDESDRYLEDTGADTAFRFCFICDCASFSQGMHQNCICNGKIVINHEYFFAKIAEKFSDFTISQVKNLFKCSFIIYM